MMSFGKNMTVRNRTVSLTALAHFFVCVTKSCLSVLKSYSNRVDGVGSLCVVPLVSSVSVSCIFRLRLVLSKWSLETR
jgi:hypothetical protein